MKRLLSLVLTLALLGALALPAAAEEDSDARLAAVTLRVKETLGIDTQVIGGRNALANLKTLTRMVREEGYDIIHSHGARGNMMAALLARKTGLPTVSTVHSDYRLDYLGRRLGLDRVSLG